MPGRGKHLRTKEFFPTPKKSPHEPKKTEKKPKKDFRLHRGKVYIFAEHQLYVTMKKIFFLFTLMFAFIGNLCFADGTYTGPLIKGTNPPQKIDDDEGERAPARPVYFTIDEVNGISPKSIADTFTNYEIWDSADEICLFATDSEEEFVAEIFKTSNAVILVKFYSEDYIYKGGLSR